MRLVSIVSPVYQNSANLPDTIPKLLSLRENLPNHRLELVLVDDGSTDGSLELLQEFQKKHPDVITVVKLTKNFGQTPCTQAGLAACSGECAIIISADLQEPYELIPIMVEQWEHGEKFVIAYRSDRGESRIQQAVSNIYWNMIRTFAMKDFPKIGYDYCLIDRQVINDVNRICEKNSSIFPLIFWLGYRPALLPITRALRRAGRSQWTLFKKMRLTINTAIAFTQLPTRIITLSALGSAGISALYLVFVLIRWIVRGGSPVPGWTSVMLVILFFGSMTLFALGIVCEYVWRILDEVRRRPPYVVDYVQSSTTAEKRASV